MYTVPNYSIGGVLVHSQKGKEWGSHKYIEKVKTASGKIRYIYTLSAKDNIKKKSKKPIFPRSGRTIDKSYRDKYKNMSSDEINDEFNKRLDNGEFVWVNYNGSNVIVPGNNASDDAWALYDAGAAHEILDTTDFKSFFRKKRR